MSNVEVPNDNDASNQELEDPVDGSTPDWMKMATSSKTGSSLTEENTPSWLKAVKSGKPAAKGPDSKTGDDLPEEASDIEKLLAEDTAQIPSPEQSSAQSFDTGDEQYEGMSDIERLLAEEGVDLSTVAEERPPEAEGMTARDWMISTSDDEMIRNRVGAGALDEDLVQGTADEPLQTTAGIDADLPDWLSDVEGDPDIEPFASVEEADDRMVVEEDLPDWLHDVDEEEAEVAQPVASAGDVADLEDKMVVEENLPEWLRNVEEGPGSETLPEVEVSELTDVGDEDLPEWLRDVEEQVDVEPIDAELLEAEEDISDKMVVEEDLPDWLRDPDEAEKLTEEPVAQPVAAAGDVADLDDKMVVEEDLPDWLREVEETEEELPTLAAEETEELPDWLQEAEQEDAEVKPVGVEALVEPVTEGGEDLVEEDELPDWLQDVEVETEETLFDAEQTESFEDEDLDDGELPEWLAEVQAEADDAFEPSEPALLDPEDVAPEGLPDWLSEVEEESIAASAEEAGELEAEMAATVAGVGALVEADELPDWLHEVDEAEPVELEKVEEVPDLTAAQLASESGLPVLEAKLEPEMEVPAAEAEPEVEGQETALELEPEPGIEMPVPELESETEVELAVSEAEFEEGVEETEPELEEMVVEVEAEPEPAEEVEIAEPESPIPEPTAAAAVVPNWLKKLREGADEEPAAVEPDTGPLPVPKPAAQVAMEASAAPEPAPRPQPVLDLPEDGDERFRLAQGAREQGDLERAIQIYESLVTSGSNLDDVIADLDLSLRSNPSNYVLHQVKGDAMMKDGRLQGALEAYRQALAKLAS